jgi:arylformamidase
VPVHDVSAPLRADLPVWPGEQGLRRELTSDLRAGDVATTSHLSMSAHAGTHIDAPVHFLEDGSGVDAYPVEAFIGPAFVADLRGAGPEVTADDLDAADVADGTERLLLLTDNAGWTRRDDSFTEDYVALHPSAAEWCTQRPLRLLGIDYLSVESFDRVGAGEAPVHVTLLGAGIAILEGIDLVGIEPGEYGLSALPVRIPGSDGAPARAVLTSS